MALVANDGATGGIGTARPSVHDEFDSNLNSILNVLQGVMGELEMSEKAYAASSSSRVKEMDLEEDESLYSPPSTLVLPTQQLSFTGSDDETSAGKLFPTTDMSRDQTSDTHRDSEVLREMARLKLRLDQREGEISMLKDDKIIRLEQCHSAAAAAQAARALQSNMAHENAQLREQIQELHNSELSAAAMVDEKKRNNIPETPSLQQRLKCSEEERDRLWANVQHLHKVSERQRHEVDTSQRSAREAQVAHNELKLRLVRLEDETISLRQRLEASGGNQRNNWNASTQLFAQKSQDTVTEMMLHMEKLEKETFSLRRRVVVADEKYFSEKTHSMELESRVTELKEELTKTSSAAQLAAKRANSLEAEGEDLRKEIFQLKNVPEINNIGRISSLEASLKEEKARAAALALQLHSLETRYCPGTLRGTPQSSHVAVECSSPVSASSTSDEVVSILQQLEVQKAASSRLALLLEEESLRRRKAEKRLGKVRKSAEIETTELQRKLNAIQSEVVQVEESFDMEREQLHKSSHVLKQDIEVARMASEGLCTALKMAQEDLKAKEQALEISQALLQKLKLKMDSEESLDVKVQGIMQELSIDNAAQLKLKASSYNPRKQEFERSSRNEGGQNEVTQRVLPKEKAVEEEMVGLRNETALLRKKLEYFTSMEQADTHVVSQMNSNESDSIETHDKEEVKQQGLNELPKRIRQLEEEIVNLKAEKKTLGIRLEEASQCAVRAGGARALAIQQMDALRESLVAETQWSSAQEKEMKRLYAEFKCLQEGIKEPMTVQQRRITDLQEANVVLIRGLESAKEEADVLRQELTSSMETKENVDTRLRDLESFREGNVNLEKNVAELQTKLQAKCEEVGKLKSNYDNVQEVHDFYASRETELIGQVESLHKELNAEMCKHRLAIEVNENLEQTAQKLKNELQSLKSRLLQHELTEHSNMHSMDDGPPYPPIFVPYSEDNSNSDDKSNDDLMKPHVAQSDGDSLSPKPLLSLGELAGSDGLVVQTWRSGFRQALSEMDHS